MEPTSIKIFLRRLGRLGDVTPMPLLLASLLSSWITHPHDLGRRRLRHGVRRGRRA